jgi:RNA polymerase sigma-70 factor (ECF subfamily)
MLARDYLVSGLLMTAEYRDWDFSRLVEEHFARAVRFCARMLGNVSEGEEVAQQAFVSLLEKGRKPWEQGDPLPFLYRVLRNACIDHTRRRKTRAAEGSLDAAAAQDLSAATAPEVIDALHAAVSELEAAQREVIVLRFFEGLELRDVAKTVGKSTGATAMLISRAKANLKAALGSLPELES